MHAHFGPLGMAALQLQTSGLLRGPLITSFHAYDISLLLRRSGSDLSRELFGRGDAFLPVTEHGAERLHSLGCPASRIRVHRMGIDLRRFEFRPPRAPTDGSVRLLSVGRLVEKKGFEYALEAVEKLVAKFPGLSYDIIGDGPLRSALKRRMVELELDGVVRLLGAMAGPQGPERDAVGGCLARGERHRPRTAT